MTAGRDGVGRDAAARGAAGARSAVRGAAGARTTDRRLGLLLDGGPLRLPAFRRLWAAGTVTALGSQLTAVALPLQIYALTGSSTFVGLAGLVGFLPMAVGALWGGAAADRRDRRRLLLATNAGIGATSLLLWAETAFGPRSVLPLFLLVALQQALFGANAAASGAVVPRLVPTDRLPAALTLQATSVNTAGVLGPLLAGALLPVVGTQPLYLADALALCGTLWAVSRLPALPPIPGPGAARHNAATGTAPGARGPAAPRQLAHGLRLVATHPVLLPTYLADFAALLLGMPAALFPQLAQQSFGTSRVGVLYGAMSAGGVLAGLLSGRLTRVRRHGLALTAGVCVWGLAIAGFGRVHSLAGAALLLALAGAGLTVLSVFRKALLQTVVTDDLRGRLQGTDTVIAAGGPRLAALTHGAAATALGPAWTITAGGLLTTLTAVTLLAAAPAFRHYRVPASPGPLPGPSAGVPLRVRGPRHPHNLQK